MKLSIRLQEGFDRTHLPLTFRAFWNDDGACYLRTRIQEGKIVFLCAQLLNYTNTSVTNAVESVRDTAIKQLLRDGGVRFSFQHSFMDKFKSRERIDQRIREHVYRFIEDNSIWIEYYPPEFSLLPRCRYAEVRFDKGNYPTWAHRPPEVLSEEFPGMDFSVSSDVLASWNKAMTAEEIKDLLKDKKWSMKQVAERWGITGRHISRVVNDMGRDKHWEDAIRGLPALNAKARTNHDSGDSTDSFPL